MFICSMYEHVIELSHECVTVILICFRAVLSILSRHEKRHFIHPLLSAKNKIMMPHRAVCEYITILRLLSVAAGTSMYYDFTFFTLLNKKKSPI